MNKLGKVLAIGFGFGLLAILLSLIPDHPVKAADPAASLPVVVTNSSLPVKILNTPLPVISTISGTANVNITNTSLPVAGTVAISSLPPVTLSGTSTVGLSGTASVQVNNIPTNPVPTEDLKETAAAIVELQCPAASDSECTADTNPTPTTAYQTPAGESLVIVDVELTTDGSGGVASVGLQVGPPTAYGFHTERWKVPNDGATHELTLGVGFVIPPQQVISIVSAPIGIPNITLRGYLTAN